MSVARGATPTFVLKFKPDVGLDTATKIYVTFTSEGRKITKTGNAVSYENNEISVFLSQSETFQFRVGEVEIQANWITPEGQRIVSEVKRYDISKQLLNEVIE